MPNGNRDESNLPIAHGCAPHLSRSVRATWFHWHNAVPNRLRHQTLKGKPEHEPIFVHQAAEDRILLGRDVEQDPQNGRFHSETSSWANVAIA